MNEPSKDLEEQRALEQELHRLAYQMAQALAELDCPDCCGEVHAFIEHGCEVYREEREWACFVQLVRYRSGGNRGRA
jgi:methionyl-tRNA synthetase